MATSEAESARHEGLAKRLGVTAKTLSLVRTIVAEEARVLERKKKLFGAA